jgi:transmembrane sensor
MEQPSDDLLIRFVANTCTPDERSAVERWYASFSQQPTLSDHQPGTDTLAYRQVLLQRIWAAIAETETKVIPLRSRRVWRYAVAATVAGLLAIGGLVYTRFASPNQVSGTVSTTAVETRVVFINQQPKIVRYALPDGSTVWLNPQARIAHASRFLGPTRQVIFTGEGFFIVQKDARHPFVVRSGQMTTEVLGTSFNVRAVQHSQQYKVAVVTGKVAVTIQPEGQRVARKVVLTPNQFVNVNLQTAAVIAETKAPQAKQAIYEPVSVQFDWTPLDEVARRLEAVYDVTITLNNSALRNCRLRADFTNQSLPAILDLIGKSTDATYTLEGRQITLNGAGCPE